MLAYLIVQRSKPVARDVAAFALWPDDDETSARANLRRHLHYLRAALPSSDGEPWIRIHGRTILQWNGDAPCSIDVADFERFSQSDASLAAADRLYTGDLLLDLNDDWILGERERLRAQELTNLTRLIAAHRREGALLEALRYAQRLLGFDPWREDALRQAMELRYALGDRAGALSQFETFAAQLRRDLNAEPMPETTACYESLQRDAPVLQMGAGVASLEPRALRPPLPFVGRENELAQLRVWWTRAARGDGAVGLLSAEAGVGKTRLLFEFKNLVEGEGGRVLAGATPSLENEPYQAMLEALSGAASALSTLRIDRVWLGALAQFWPQLAARYPGLEAPVISADRVRERLFEAFFQILKALSDQRPTLLILEDLHWAGGATIELLERLSRRLTNARLLIVASYREEEISRAHPLRQLRRGAPGGRSIVRLSLGPLDPTGVEALVAKLSARLPPDPAWPQLLYGHSEGNALFLTQLVATALEHGASAPLREALAGGVTEIIRARLASLGADARSLALIAAVVGDAFDAELLQEVVAWDSARIADALDELLDRRFIRDAGFAESGHYAFGHHLIEATAYAEASRQDLRRRHERVAVALQDLYPAKREELSYRIARHFERGAQRERAAAFYARAAEFASSRFAYEDAVARAAAGLALAASDEQRRGLLLIREDAYARLGDAAAREADLDALTLLADPNDRTTASELARRRVSLFHSADRRLEEDAAIGRLWELAGRSGSPRALFEASFARARFAMLSSHADAAVVDCERSLEYARAAQDTVAQTRAYCLLADIFDRRAEFPSAHEALAKAEALAECSGDVTARLAVLLMSCRLANWENRYDDLQRAALRMFELSTACGDRGHEGTAENALGVAALYRFEVEEARRHFAGAVDIFRAMNRPRNIAAAELNLVLLHTRMGCLEDAIAVGEATRTLAERADASLFLEAASCLTAESYLRKSDLTRARALASEALALSTRSGSRNRAPAMLKLARCDAACGDFEAALARIDEALSMLAVAGLEVQRCDALADRCSVAMSLGRFEAACANAEAFLPTLRADPGRFAEPEALFTVAARLFSQIGPDEDTASNLRAAGAIYRQRLARISDAASRHAYASLAVHRELVEMLENAYLDDR
ncbi:MAG: AAA family ATPase [Candidatus Eremiobacteraeota bacterium]|nr:AAA family ATPase [Candidatus Eremiobacteraeota bacterium]